MTTRIAAQQPVASSDSVAQELSKLLADTYTLYLKSQGYHWNVTGPHFGSLHLMFEGLYTELAAAVDEIAERIRALGSMAPGSYREMARLTGVRDEGAVPDAMQMVRHLIDATQIVVGSAREVASAAETANDPASLDLATRRISAHEKSLWMLRATVIGGDDRA
jgi:starvation-inducible DNA-binding protein